MANRSERSSITIKLLGDPKKVLGMEGANARHFLGTIFGVAEKVKTKTGVDKAGNTVTFEPIIGNFEAVPATPVQGDEGEPPTDAYQSGILYLPGGIHDRITEALKMPDTPPIEFGIEVYTVKSSNAAGYTYDLKVLLDTKAADPLSAMRDAIALKSKSVARLVAPAKAPEKGKAA